jgi:hypothetical protein
MPSDRRITLVGEIRTLTEGVVWAFEPKPDSLETRHLIGRGCPEPGDIPVATLRRLHRALNEFYAEAQAAEDAKLLAEHERAHR